jgi:DNA polymerase III subunit delta
MSDPQVKPVYVLQGNDSFLRDAAREEIVSQIIGQSDPQVAISQFDADAELAAVLDELRTTPFLAPRRAVIVRDADAFIARYREIDTTDPKTNRIKTRRPLDEYLQSPSTHSSLILLVSSWPSNTTLAKVIAKIGEVYDCSSPDASKLPDFLKKAAARRNKKIQPDAAQLLMNWVGSDLAGLENEMEKLSLYVGEKPTITMEDVSKLVTATAGAAAFALTNAITAGDTAGALKALGQMLGQRGEEFKMLGQIVWHLKRALGAQQKIAAGTAPQRALPYNMPYNVQGPFLAYLKRRPLEKLQQDFRRLIAADLAMKSGVKADAAMTDLVVQLCM